MLASPKRVVLPITIFPVLHLTGARVVDMISSAQAQIDVVKAMYGRYRTPAMLTAMDLSVEAEVFGCTLHGSENEVSSVIGRLVPDMEAAKKLAVPKAGDGRSAVCLDVVRGLCTLPDRPLVFGGCIGPFSLAAFSALFINALPIWRKRFKPRDLQDLRARILEERCVYILFPEGTRTRTGEMGRFRPGIGRLVAGTEIPVVPCHLAGAFEAWPPGGRCPRFCRIHLRIGAPMRFAQTSDDRDGWIGVAAAAEKAVRKLGGEGTDSFARQA